MYARAGNMDVCWRQWKTYATLGCGGRNGAVQDLYGDVGNFSAFRTEQAWLS